MTNNARWEPHEHFGLPIRVGQWMYAGSVPLAVRLFKSNTRYGSGDYEDEVEIQDDQEIVCYYLELQVAGEDRWGSHVHFLTLDDVERFGRESLNGSLKWFEP